ncbi:MAG: exodeoxyribonuclease VII large subunit [Clostridiales bacterium]|nr:exodeoxyribonuclease VII large subunit [Clostridiales bacterium]
MHPFASVSELNSYAEQVVSSDPLLSNLEVTGEISGFKVYASGHAYFTLKDQDSQISAVMFASKFSTVNFRPKDGDKVTVGGYCTIYKVRGSFQIMCNSMRLAGSGTLKAQLKALYDRLDKEGLFAKEHKLPLPVRPRRIGIISSATGAVIHDMLVKLNERNPYFDAVLYPASVQGENCPSEVIDGIDYFSSRNNVDVIIIARGGGSIEDLWGFNDETLARRVYDCKIPVISAIGHETDVTILDWVADKRSPTPTAAAEDVIKTYEELKTSNGILREKLHNNMRTVLTGKRAALDSLRTNRALFEPEYVVKTKRNELNALNERLRGNEKNLITVYRKDLLSYIDKLAILGPHNVLRRGYSYVTLEDGTPASSVDSVSIDSNINIVFSDGEASAVVTGVSKEVKNG